MIGSDVRIRTTFKLEDEEHVMDKVMIVIQVVGHAGCRGEYCIHEELGIT
jgi:hypothetical protein